MSQNKIFLEATLNWDEQEQKMDAWHAGKRGFNVTAASDEKLKVNYDICIRKNYSKEASIIRAEAAIRRLPWAQVSTAKITKLSDAIVMPNWDEIQITEGILNAIDYTWDRQDNIDRIIENFKTLDTTLIDVDKSETKNKAILACVTNSIQVIIILLLLDKAAAATRLKDYLYEMYGITGKQIKQIIETFLADERLLWKVKQALNKKKNAGLTEAIEKHETLNPLLWNSDNTLKDEVKEKIDLIVQEFVDGLKEDEITLEIKDVKLVGSNCSYNYTDKSDLDVHIECNTENLDCPDNLYPKLYSAYRSIFNNKLDIDFYGIQVELYVETEESTVNSNGIYSVLNNKWIKEPVAESIPDIDQKALDDEFATWEERYKEIIDAAKAENIELDEKVK